jgi:GR25 family glycosyltransferase involved in LPS biosynthesis
MIKHCFYLNLDRKEDRRKFIESELNKSEILKGIYKRFAAVDGYKINPRLLPEGLLTENAIEDVLMDTITAWGLSLTQGGLGILLSYLKLFEKIVDLNESAIIIEDDITINPNFDSDLTKILNELPDDFDLCYLGYGGQKIDYKNYSDNLIIPTGIITCTPSLIFSPKGAKKLLEILNGIDNQIDTSIYLRLNQLNAFAAKNRLVTIKNEFGTDIQGNFSCKKEYQKQNHIITTIAYGDLANNNALKLAHDLNFFKQKLLIVTNQKELFKYNKNVIIVEYPNKKFSYNDKRICFEEGLKYEDAVVYVDSDTRIFYKNYKNCYTNFLRIIKPGFHKSWVWGCVNRSEGGFFTSTDINGRIKGYGELALKLSNELGINTNNAFHHQEGMLILCKEDGKEKIFLETWKYLSEKLDEYEITNNSKKIGIGEGNIIGLSLSKSEMTINDETIPNYLGQDLKYNFYGFHITNYCKNYPNRKTVKFGDGTLIKSNSIDVVFNDKIIDLSYSIFDLNEDLMILTFNWNENNAIEFLDHEFKINGTIFHFNSEKSNEIHFQKLNKIEIEHTYDWYGQRDWKTIEII